MKGINIKINAANIETTNVALYGSEISTIPNINILCGDTF